MVPNLADICDIVLHQLVCEVVSEEAFNFFFWRLRTKIPVKRIVLHIYSFHTINYRIITIKFQIHCCFNDVGTRSFWRSIELWLFSWIWRTIFYGLNIVKNAFQAIIKPRRSFLLLFFWNDRFEYKFPCENWLCQFWLGTAWAHNFFCRKSNWRKTFQSENVSKRFIKVVVSTASVD